jgi:hypothetical protein
VQCEQVVDSLDEFAAGSSGLPPAARHHVETCLRCQAEVVQYRRLLRALHGLRLQVLEPAPGLLPDLLASIESSAERRALQGVVSGRRLAYLGGIAAAGGAAAVVLASRSRRRLTIAS